MGGPSQDLFETSTLAANELHGSKLAEDWVFFETSQLHKSYHSLKSMITTLTRKSMDLFDIWLTDPKNYSKNFIEWKKTKHHAKVQQSQK